MKDEVQIPFSVDSITIEDERIASLFDVAIVRISVRNQRIALTPQRARELGYALLRAANPTNHGATARYS